MSTLQTAERPASSRLGRATDAEASGGALLYGERRSTSLFLHVSGLLVAIVVWWCGSLLLSGQFQGFSPLHTLPALGRMLLTQHFHAGLFASLERLVGGLGIATLLGVPTGLAIGSSDRLNQMTYILFQFLRMTSPLSWMPVAVILLGVGSAPVYFLIAIAAIWPLIINTAQGVHKVDPTWIQVAKTLGAKRLGVLRRVIWPAVLPDILTGLRIALGVSWIVIVPAEMLGVASGLGYMILDFRDVVDYASLMAVILVIGFLGYITDLLVLALKQKYSWEV